ncbi:hypothetical protein [Aestuariispira ectoiniformans]|uniref:hypothetical protein n=1 Tax=Aestuariispira ectoiniformans TaxID=2775080 RepID=UPI00405672FD
MGWKELGGVHCLAKAQRAHVSPDFFDVIQAFLLGALKTITAPPVGDLAIYWPDRVLLFMIENNSVAKIFIHISTHTLYEIGFFLKLPLRDIEN